MATKQSVQVAAKDPLASSNGSEPITLVGDYTLLATESAADVIEMVGLPAGYVPVDVIIDTEDLGATITGEVGILTGTFGDTVNARTCGAQFIAASALGTAGIKRMDVAGGGRIAPTTADRGLGISLTAFTTPTAGAKVRMTVTARPQIDSV